MPSLPGVEGSTSREQFPLFPDKRSASRKPSLYLNHRYDFLCLTCTKTQAWIPAQGRKEVEHILSSILPLSGQAQRDPETIPLSSPQL